MKSLLVGLVARVPARVQAKLLAAFLAMVGLLIALGAVGLDVLSGVNQRTEELIKLQRKIAAYRQVQHDTTAQLYSVSSALLSSDDRTLENALRQLNRFGYDLERLQFVAKDEAELLGQVRKEYERFIDVAKHVVELIRGGHVVEAQGVQLAQAGPLADRLERLTSKLVNKAEADMVEGIEASEQAYRTSRSIVIAFALGSIVLALGLGYVISWSLIGPVTEIDARLSQIAAGDFTQRVRVVNRDELGALAAGVNRMCEELGRLYQQLEARTRELTESLEQQTATADVLKLISRSTFDLQPVLDALIENAARLCGAEMGFITRLEGDVNRLSGSYGVSEEFRRYVEENPPRLDRGNISGRAVLEGRAIQIVDVLADPEYERVDFVQLSGWRTGLGVPLVREGVPFGAFALVRKEARPFTDKQIELVTTFADQAVIAIENVRLLNELRARSAELARSVEELTATSEVLKVISRSTFDLEPVLATLVETAARLCHADHAVMFRRRDDLYHLVACFGITDEFKNFVSRHPLGPGGGTVAARAVMEGRIVHVADVLADPEYTYFDGQRLGGYRTIVGVPLVREDTLVGVFTVMRTRVDPFTAKEIELLTTFADQAVIAIENARLLKELRESLEQQTATSEVLRVVSSSPGELEPVFQTMLANATRICEAKFGTLWLSEGDMVRAVARHGVPPALPDLWREPFRPGPDVPIGRVVRTKQLVHIADVSKERAYVVRDPLAVVSVEQRGVRTILAVPMLKENELIGAFAIYRQEVRPFTDKQIELVTSFASQAVIAIENVRLLKELRARTAELARSVDELKTLSEVGQAVSSTLDLKTVLTTIVARAVELSGADSGTLFRYRKAEREFRLDTSYGLADDVVAAIRGVRIHEAETIAIGRAVKERVPIEIPDVSKAPNFPVRDILYAAGFRSSIIVPLVGPDRVFGALAIQRKTPGTFPESTVRLMQTFASQSALAIQNARLFREIDEQGHQLAIASQHKSQFLANMSHELRTPLNAILGYAELMADGLYGMLPEKSGSVLERIQANGKYLLGLINDVLDLSKIEAGQLKLSVDEYSLAAVVQTVMASMESLARGKSLALSATIQDGIPTGRGDERRLTQVLMNLVGNAIKFTERGSVAIRASAGDGRFEVAVADTGPGIAPEDRQRIFEEFQQVDSTSTRKKGGSGLGLAISKKIVEMHGGRIEVESSVGQGSTFHVIIPQRAEPAEAQ